MRTPQRLLLVAALLGLAGCSAMLSQGQPQEPPAQGAEGPAKEAAVAELPSVELTPELLYQLLLAEFAGQGGALPLSADLYLKAARETRDPRLAQRATRIAVYARNSDSALAAARLWVELSPEDVDARQSLAALLIREGRGDEALPHLKKVLSLSPDDDHHGYLVVANLLAREQDKQHALQVMEQLIAPEHDNPDALYAYAQLANQLGANEEAEGALSELLEKQPDYTQALLLQARVLHSLGKGEAALASLRRALKQAPDNDQLRLTYARMLVDARHLGEARKQFRTLNRHLPDNGDVLYALGLLAMEAGDLDDAEIHFTELVANGDREEEARFALGQIAEARQQPQEAIEWYRSVPQGERYMSAQLQAARLIAQSEGIEAARRALQQLPLHSPEERIQRYLAEAELLSSEGRLEEAMEVYDEGLALFIDNTDLLYSRALTAEKIDRLDILERDLQRILAKDPDNAQALNALGYTLTDRTGRHEEALGYIERAYRQHPEDPAILDSMGWVLYHLNRKEEALQYLQRAAGMIEDPEIAAHLGEVLWSLGRREEARRTWNKALEAAPEHKLLQQTIERFTQ
jgi:tetratricopeptide (TPR) repeat protein